MKDKDKLFLIVYFGVKNRPMDIRTNQIMIGFYENIKKTLDDTVKVYVVPQPTTDSVKFELLHIKEVGEDKFNEIENKFNLVLKALHHEK